MTDGVAYFSSGLPGAWEAAFYSREKARLGVPEAITAAAHKLARIMYSMLRYGQNYIDQGAEYYETQYRQRVLRAAQRRAAQLGYHLIPASNGQAQVSVAPASTTP